MKSAAILILFSLCTFISAAQNTDSTLRVDTSLVAKKTIADTQIKKKYTFTGKVVDANTSEGIPFAAVFFLHTTLGTPADFEGNFSMSVDTLPSDTLHIETTGYNPVNKPLLKTRYENNFIIELERKKTELKDFTISAKWEDPALIMIRKVIAHKPDNDPDKLDNYSYESYNRLEADMERMTKAQFSKIPMLKSYSFIFDNLDTVSEDRPYLPLYMTETLSDYYYSKDPKKQREFIKASMVKGVNNENVSKYLGSLYQNVNVYKNYIPVFDKKFVSPIADDGPFFYRYKIVDTQTIYNHRIIHMSYRPRREGENCFVGDLWFADTVYALQRISMDVSALANLNWVDRVSLYQEFEPFDTIWFCIKDKFIANFTIYNSKKLPAFIGRKTTTYHHIKVNNDSVSHVLLDPQWRSTIIKSDSAKKYDNDWWAKNRPDSLSKNEKAINRMVDTINSMPITTLYKNTITFFVSGVKDIGYFQLGPYYYVYSSNPVEGNRFRFSAGTSHKIKNFHLTSYLAYGTKDEAFKYGGSALWILKREPRVYLYGSYNHDLDQNTNYYGSIGADNIFNAMFHKPNIPWKMAFSDDKRLEFYRQGFTGFSFKTILQNKSFTPYFGLPSKGIFFDNNLRPVDAVTKTEVGLELRYAYKEKYVDGPYMRLNLGSKYPIVMLEISKSLNNVLNCNYDYLKTRFTISESINTPPFGHIRYSLFAGKYFSNEALPYPLLEIHPGNEFYTYNKNAFEMMNRYEFLSDEYVGFNFEHNIGGGVFNHIPLLKQMRMRQFWTAKGAWGMLNNKNIALNFDKGFPFRELKGVPYLELGTGVSNIFQFFRVDFVWRVTPKPQSSENLSRYFGIFATGVFEF